MPTTPPGSEHTVASAAQALLADFDVDDVSEVENQERDDADDQPDERLETEEAEPETEVEAESDDESDEEAEPEPVAEEPQRFVVKVDGEEQEVTLEELRAGYSRQADYTRKTQEIAQQRKQIEQELAAAREEQKRYAKQLAELEAGLQPEPEPTEEQWQQLYEQNPVEWVRQRELMRDRREKRERLIRERQQLELQQQQEQARQLQETVQQEQRRLVEAIPEWSDAEKAKMERNDIRRYAHDIGFSDDDIAQVYDHRLVLVLRDAAKYRALMAKQSQVQPSKPKAPKTAPPGAASTPAEQQTASAKKLKQRLRETGRLQDAAALMENML